MENEFRVYDTTTLSSYSETLRHVQYGCNKEHDHLPQLHLALVFGQESNLPFYYRNLAGNIPDSKTLRHLPEDLDIPGYSRVRLVMDRGFYRKDNINGLFQNHVKFLVSVRMSLVFIQKELDAFYDTFRSFGQYREDHGRYYQTVRTTRDYTQNRPYKGDTLQESRRLYIHYYYTIERAAEDENTLNVDRRFIALKQELESGNRVPEHEKLYQQYFIVKTTPRRGTNVTVSVRDENVSNAR